MNTDKQTAARLESAARKHASARAALENEIRAARYYGMPLRTIAKHAGVSHEKVRGLISKDQASGS